MDNLSLFDMKEPPGEKGLTKSAGHKLDVVKMSFEEAQTMTWQELFDGFDSLHAITFSSGIGFVCSLLKKFKQAEIVFGCDDVLSYELQEIMAYQYKTLERLSDNADKNKIDLVSRINDGSLHLFVARTILSHEKIYLLSSDDGRKRVIMGSANMSHSAFGGIQRENISYIDGEKAFDWYMNCYAELRDSCTDNIAVEALMSANIGDNLDALPIAGTVKVKKAMVIEPAADARSEVRFMLDVRQLASKLGASVPKPDKKGKLLLSPEKIHSIRRQVVAEQIKEKELRSEYPQFVIYPDEKLARLNDQTLDLNPSTEEIKKDVALFQKYMSGYDNFHGDTIGMQKRYFEFANWFFCSPFMAAMRDTAKRYNQNLLPYPVFGLLYGQSKAGKTSFLETLLIMMIGQKTKISAPDFTRSSIEKLKYTVQGAPIIVDDLTNTRFNQHAIETIKNDDFGIVDHLTNYPAVVISANEDVKAVAPEVIRRTVICRVQAGLTNTEVMQSSVVRSIQREIGTAFYREYLRRMLEQLPDLIERMKDEEIDDAPDILEVSSDIILSLIKEYGNGTAPHYARHLTLEDYFSEKVTGSYAIKVIHNAWKTSKKSFEISRRANELRYNAGATWEADRLMKELPETLEPHKARDWVVMNLDEAQAFFGLTFKKSIWPWEK